MKYKTGMYGGAIAPHHLGHIKIILQAASICEILFVVLSWSDNRDNFSKEIRYRWILDSVKHLPNVKIVMVEDKASSKNLYDWEQGSIDIKNAIREPIDVVFLGEDYQDKKAMFESLYPDSFIKIMPRNHISSTLIRENPFKHWEDIPKIVKPYYTKKVLILGSESTGKSTMAENLAKILNGGLVKEVGRDICDIAGGEDLMVAEDFEEILIRHREQEIVTLKEGHKYLIVDTNASTTNFYIDFLVEGKNSLKNLANSISSLLKYDYVFFLEPTVPFVQDGTRNEKILEDRIFYSNQLKKSIEDSGINFISISHPNYFDRLTFILEKLSH